jgi:hypothetical protein
MGEWRYSYTILDVGMKVSVQLYGLAALPPVKKPPVPIS